MSWFNGLKRLGELSREYMGLVRLSGQVFPLPAGSDEEAEERQALAVEDIWEKRTRLAGQMLLLSQQLAPAWQNWPACLEELEPNGRQEALEVLELIRKNTQAADMLDRDTLKVYHGLLDEVKIELMQINQKGRALKAYRPASLVSPQHSLPFQLSRTT